MCEHLVCDICKRTSTTNPELSFICKYSDEYKSVMCSDCITQNLIDITINKRIQRKLLKSKRTS